MNYTKNQQKFIDINIELEKLDYQMYSSQNAKVKPKDDPFLKLYNKTYSKMNNLVYKMYSEDKILNDLRELFNHTNEWVSYHSIGNVWVVYDDSLMEKVKEFEKSKNKRISHWAGLVRYEGPSAIHFRPKFFEMYNKWLAKKKVLI
jgi:hypothetical protein